MTTQEINLLILCGALLLVGLFGVWLIISDKAKEKTLNS